MITKIDELPEDFEREFRALVEDKTTVELVTTRFRAWCLMSAVQLASRHPEAMKTEPMRVAVEMARNIQRQLAATPALERVAEQGWDQTQDLPW